MTDSHLNIKQLKDMLHIFEIGHWLLTKAESEK